MKHTFGLIEDAVTRRRIPDIIPLYEHIVDDPIIERIMDYDFSKIDGSVHSEQLELWKKRIEFYRQMGYVFVPMEIAPKFASRNTLKTECDDIADIIKRGWVDEHDGPIRTSEDLENPQYWPDVDHAFNYELFEKVANLLPEGMKVIGGASGGPFEHASFLMGLEGLCIALCEDEDFVERLFERIGTTITGIAERLVKIDKLGIYRFGDDLGYKSSTIISPDALRKYVFPWQKKVVDVVHKAGKPFLLHSCGQLQDIMDDLIDYVGIDAKHSFEDIIMPVIEAKKKWGERIAILGGIDVDFLCRQSKQAIKEHTKRVLEECSKGGGYAAGSGNTITSYMPPENYIAMVEAVREFNGQ